MASLYPVFARIGRVHAHLLDDGHGVTLIDALDKPDGRAILQELDRIGRQPSDLKHIILTHAHPTHVKGAAALKQASGARVAAHPAEQEIIEGRAPSGHTTWAPQRPWVVLPQQYLLNLSRVLWFNGIKVPLLTHPPVEIDDLIEEDGQQIGPVVAFHTPGHSPGSTSFYWPETETLFVGDAVVTWPVFELGWKGLCEDYEENARSMRRLVAWLEQNNWAVRRIASGHGPPRDTDDGIRDLKKLLDA